MTARRATLEARLAEVEKRVAENYETLAKGITTRIFHEDALTKRVETLERDRDEREMADVARFTKAIAQPEERCRWTKEGYPLSTAAPAQENRGVKAPPPNGEAWPPAARDDYTLSRPHAHYDICVFVSGGQKTYTHPGHAVAPPDSAGEKKDSTCYCGAPKQAAGGHTWNPAKGCGSLPLNPDYFPETSPEPPKPRRWYRCEDCYRTFPKIYDEQSGANLHWGPTGRCDPVGNYRWTPVLAEADVQPALDRLKRVEAVMRSTKVRAVTADGQSTGWFITLDDLQDALRGGEKP